MNNFLKMTDSYKVSHHSGYVPGLQGISSYLESRGGEFPETVFFGLQYYLNKIKGCQVSTEKIDEAEDFWSKHFGRKDVFDRSKWEYIRDRHEGQLPLIIHAVPEGTIIPTGNVLMTIDSTDDKCSWLVNYAETLLMKIWYPITVATQSLYIRKDISNFLKTSGAQEELVNYKCHDFGYRGTTCEEHAAIGAAAHLLSFSGTDTVAGIDLLQKYYYSDVCGFSIPACYDDVTEILTDTGFKRFEKLEEKDLVAQYHEDGSITFVKPTQRFKDRYNGEMISFQKEGYCDLMVTPNHRMVKKSIATKKVSFFEAEKGNYSHRQNMIVAGRAKNQTVKAMSPIETLKVAFQADGSYPSRPKAYTGKNAGTYPIRFSLKKDRKKERLRKILNFGKISYSESLTAKNYSEFWIPLKESFSKNFDWIDLNAISYGWAVDFINELQFWDGCAKGNCIIYSSTNKSCVDKVQAIAAIANYKTKFNSYLDKRGDRQRIYTLVIDRNRNCIVGSDISKTSIQYNGYVYCVSVPSKMLIVRRNNIVSICGNTEHSVMCSFGRDGEIEACRNWLNQYPTGLIACVSDTYDIFNCCENIWGGVLRDQVKNRQGTLVIRPDSGKFLEIVPRMLDILWNKFGGHVNYNGFRVLHPSVRVIQGDGMTRNTINQLYSRIMDLKYSAENLAVGSGGGLLVKDLTRDTNKFAIKASAALVNGKWIDIYKDPITDSGKRSKRGRLKLIKENGEYKTVRLDDPAYMSSLDILRPVFYNGELSSQTTLTKIKDIMHHA